MLILKLDHFLFTLAYLFYALVAGSVSKILILKNTIVYPINSTDGTISDIYHSDGGK